MVMMIMMANTYVELIMCLTQAFSPIFYNYNFQT